MYIFPAIDLMEGCAVRLVRGDYAQKTVYSTQPAQIAKQFEQSGAEFLHLVDLEGAKYGTTPNLQTIQNIVSQTTLKVEVGGGIRDEQTIQQYLNAGVYRVILGTAALKQPLFLKEMIEKYKERIAVGVDLKNGMVAVDGWTKQSNCTCDEFCEQLQAMGVKTIICTDISKDGLLSGTNLSLYQHLQQTYNMDIIASGGVSSLDDIQALQNMGVYGAIVGKALYTGNIDLSKAIKIGKGETI